MKNIISIFAIVCILAGCRKENSDEFFPYPGSGLNDTAWYTNPAPSASVHILGGIFVKPPFVDSVSGVNGGVLNFNDSVIISFPAGFCQGQGGTTITDKVRIEVTHLARKGDMIRYNRPTMSYHQLLVTGGSLFIKATFNGQEVQMSPSKSLDIKIVNKFTATPSPAMRVFYGNETANISPVQPFTWVPWQDSSRNIVSIGTVQTPAGAATAYFFQVNRFRWVNCDYFSDTTQQRTRLMAVLPPNFTNANTHVFAVFKNMDIVAQLRGNPVARVFFLENAYVGKDITLVSVSKIDNKLYLGAKELTITANMNTQMQPEEKTKQQIENFLNGL